MSGKTIADFVAHPSPTKYNSLRPTSRTEFAYIDGPQTIWTSWHVAGGRYVIVNLAYDRSGNLHFVRGQAHRLSVS